MSSVELMNECTANLCSVSNGTMSMVTLATGPVNKFLHERYFSLMLIMALCMMYSMLLSTLTKMDHLLHMVRRILMFRSITRWE